MDEDDPRRSMPVMYQRQRELADGSFHFYTGTPQPTRETDKQEKSMVQQQRNRKRGRMMLFGNIALLVIAIVVFRYLNFNEIKQSGVHVQVTARWLEPQIIAGIRVSFDETATQLAGRIVRVWVWHAVDGQAEPTGELIPEDAVNYVDVLPALPDEQIVFRERFGVEAGSAWERSRICVVVETEAGRVFVKAVPGKD